MEALWATILFSGFALEVIIRPNRFYSSSIVKHLRFNPNLKVGEDVDFIINFLRKAQTGVYIPQCNYFYRLRASSLSKADISPLENMLNLENDLKKSPENLYLKNYIKKINIRCLVGNFKACIYHQ